MKVLDLKWGISSRDVWHGVKCLNHCLKVSMAVATEQPSALEKTEHIKKSNGALFREAQGNDYEDYLNNQLESNLGSKYHQIPDYSNPNQVKIAASAGKIVISQAPFEIDFGHIVYSGRADLLVRNDYDLGFLEDGTLGAVQNNSSDSNSYNVWEIKHSSAKDAKGKLKDLTNYEYQLAMAVEGMRSLGLGTTRLAGILFKNREIVTFEPNSILDDVTQARKDMFDHLEQVSPLASSKSFETSWYCPQNCEDSRCDYPGICSKTRYEMDLLNILYKPHYTHIPKLNSIGIFTVSDLLSMDASKSGIDVTQIEKHLVFAELIQSQKKTGLPCYKLLNSVWGEPNSLPKPTEKDLFMDFEWFDILNSKEKFCYLFGVSDRSGSVKQFYTNAIESEESVFFEFLDFVSRAIDAHEDMHIFVVNRGAEETRIKELAAKYVAPEETIAKILGRIFDLLDSARSSVAVSTASYGLKDMKVYFEDKTTEVSSGTKDGEDSMYTFWKLQKALADGDDVAVSGLEKELLNYNAEDCVATIRYYNWLASLG
jgi:predicted RecB family nuclease